MMRNSRQLAAVFAALLLAGAALARADGLQRESGSVWAAETDCSREAFKHFPDYTADSNAKRENYRRACLRAKGLPAENGSVPIPGN
jgi:hypothetical protein